MARSRERPAWKHFPEVVAIVISVSAVPMVAGWVPPNPYYGFRIPGTMAPPQEWYAANRLMGCYIIASQVVALTSMDRFYRAMLERFRNDRSTWGVLWSCATALVGIGGCVLQYAVLR